MARYFRAVKLGSFALLSTKALFLTMNDEWDEVRGRFFRAPPPAGHRRPRVVVLGSGWAAATFIKKLDQEAVDLTIVSPRSFFFYTPLLAGTATGTVSATSIMEPMRWYCARAGHGNASFIQAECTAIDPVEKHVTLASSGSPASRLEYDHLVIAVGAVPNTFNIAGVREHARFFKEVEDGIVVQRALLSNLERASALLEAAGPSPSAAAEAEAARLLSWVVIGGGPTGVELCGELADFLRAEVARYFPALAPRVRITLLEAADRVLGTFDKELSATAAKTLAALGVRVMVNAAVTRVAADAVEFRARGGEAGAVPHGGVCVWAGGVARRPVVDAFAKQLDPRGEVQNSRHGLLVDPFFRVKGAPPGSVFALGDCAVSGCAPTAQAAVQQGRFLGRAFRDSLGALAAADPGAACGGALPVAPFVFRPRGALAYTGGGTGVAELSTLRAALWDAHPERGAGLNRVEGAPAFAIWRSLYFSSILSFSNQAAVAFDWTRACFFGREISTPWSTPEKREQQPTPST
jgi:NADH:ubiquinone reductase (non-electrogenic)